MLRAQLIQMLYSVRSERLLMEEIDYSVLFRWFVGMNLDEPVWDVTVFTKNRDRLLDGDVAREFLCEVVKQAQEKKLTSDEHFTVDGTLVEAWASLKSFQPKDGKNTPPDDPGNPTVAENPDPALRSSRFTCCPSGLESVNAQLKRIIGFGVHNGIVDGVALCRQRIHAHPPLRPVCRA